MSINGLRNSWNYLEFTLSSSGTYSGSGVGTPSYSHGGTGETHFVPNVIDILAGISIELSSSWDGSTGAWSAKYTGPGSAVTGYVQSGASYLGTVSLTVRFTNYKLYGTGSYHYVKWDEVLVSVNGGAFVSISNATGDNEQGGGSYGASYVPVHAIPIKISPTCGQSRPATGPAYDPCDPEAGYPIANSSTMQSSLTGGWHFDDGTGVQALPVNVVIEEPPSGSGCPFGLDLDGIVSAGDTDSGSVSARSHTEKNVTYEGRDEDLTVTVEWTCTYVDPETEERSETSFTETLLSECELPCGLPDGPAFQDKYKTVITSEGHGGSVRLVPNLDNSLRKIGQRYGASLFRLNFPYARGLAVRSCTDGATTNTYSQTHAKYPSSAQFAEFVGPTLSNVEDFLRPTITEVSASRSKSISTTWTYERPGGPCQCPPPGSTFPGCPPGWTVGVGCATNYPTNSNDLEEESVSYVFPSEVETWTGLDQHVDKIARLNATWWNPWHRIFFLRDNWEVDGSPVADADYWGKLRTSWNSNPAFDPGNNPATRTHHVLAPMQDDNANTPYLDLNAALQRWVGAAAFEVESSDIPAEVQLSTTIPSVWTPKENSGTPECTVTLGSNVVLTGFTGATAQVDVSLAQWSERPYLQLLLAKRVLLGWSATNVTSIEAFLVGADGEETSLGTTTGWKDISYGGQTKYAGSWAQDFGCGVVTDSPADATVDGRSSSTLASNTENVGFQLGHGRQYQSLRFKATPTNTANPVTLNWPKFELHNTHPQIFNENGHVSILVWPDGPAVRVGGLTHYKQGDGWQHPPIIRDPEFPSTVLDGIAISNALFRGVHPELGGGAFPTVATRLTQIYDTFEGQGYGSSGRDSLFTVLPKGDGETIRIALVASHAEIPPLAAFPLRSRGGTWLQTGGYFAGVYDESTDLTTIVSGGDVPATLKDDTGTSVGALSASPPAGWYVHESRPALDNTEVDWQVDAGGLTLAEVRPWRGWFVLHAEAATGGSGPSVWGDDLGQRWIATIAGGGVRLYSGRTGTEVSEFPDEIQVTTNEDDTAPDGAASSDGALYLVWQRGTDVYRGVSYDDGQTFDIESVGAGLNPRVTSDDLGTVAVAKFTYNSGSSGPGRIAVQVKRSYETAFGSFVTLPVDVDDTGFDISSIKSSGGEWLIVATASGSLKKFQSRDDAMTWEDVS